MGVLLENEKKCAPYLPLFASGANQKSACPGDRVKGSLDIYTRIKNKSR
jgi:hypothetical protein